MNGHLHLPDGRRLSWQTYGDRDGMPVLALHGTPGSRLKFAAADTAARAHAIRLVSLDRWGYGRSDHHPAPSLTAFAVDAAAIADELRLGRFGVIGVSGGGPFAAALAAHLPARVSALALVAPVGEMHPRAGRRAPVGAFHRFCFGALPRLPGAIRGTFELFRLLTKVAPLAAVRLASLRAGPADREILADRQFADGLGRTFREGLARSAIGPVIDMGLFARPWDVPLDAIACPARVWVGGADRNVPLGPAAMLASSIPAASLRRLDGAGHFWIARHVGEVLEWLSGLHAPAVESKRRP